MLINGCQEGKATPRLTEVKCPNCGQYVEVFVLMGGPIGKTGTLAGDDTILLILSTVDAVDGVVEQLNAICQ